MLRWHKDTHDAILWLRSHKHLFKMEVFEPPYMCMTVPDKRYQDSVEALINSAQLRVRPFLHPPVVPLSSNICAFV